jgi:hypothetical protein
MNKSELKVHINGEDRVIPVGVKLLDESDLYMAEFSLLQLKDPSEEVVETGDYQWSNPRRLGEQGLNVLQMAELYSDIKDEGLMFPFICRWVIKNGELVVQVLDGERRWRCIDTLISKQEQVWCRAERKWRPASEVYRAVPCRILTGNDIDALKVAFMVSDRSVNWGDAAVAKLIRKLRNCGCGDEKILDVTKKSSQWLREQDRICSLDDLTFTYLTDGKINRALALKLADIDDLDRRHRHLRGAYDNAVSTHQEVIDKAEEDLSRAVEKEEFAEAILDEVTVKGEDTGPATLSLQEAAERTQQKRQARASAARPKAKTANLRRAATKLAEEEDVEVGEDVSQPLRVGKIQKQLESIQEIIANGGKDEEGKDVLDVTSLRACEVCYKAIISGDEDIIKLLRRQRAVNILYQHRIQQKAQEHEAVVEDETDE